jgi:hypothetical protein
MDTSWGVVDILDDGSAFVSDTSADDCVVRTRLGLLDPAGHPVWWNPR